MPLPTHQCKTTTKPGIFVRLVHGMQVQDTDVQGNHRPQRYIPCCHLVATCGCYNECISKDISISCSFYEKLLSDGHQWKTNVDQHFANDVHVLERLVIAQQCIRTVQLWSRKRKKLKKCRNIQRKKCGASHMLNRTHKHCRAFLVYVVNIYCICATALVQCLKPKTHHYNIKSY